MRPDLADLTLQGEVAALRYVQGEVLRVTAPQAPLRREPSETARLDTEALYGELVSVFERPGDWAWVQLAADRYVGWMPLTALENVASEPTHRVKALRTFVFSEPDIKSPPLAALPLGATVTVVSEAQDTNARYALIGSGGAIVRQHLEPLSARQADWVAVAELFLNTPYLWGGKTSLGIDCSALVQVALGACGIKAPRDSDMQEREVGVALPISVGLPPLKRGDFVFWRGHVGIMCDAETLLHANAHHMAVVAEPVAETVSRLGTSNPVRAVKRIA
jgi:cell wall-associated NlpC family hydrolase